MKKIIMAFGIAGIALGFAACTGSTTGSTATGENAAFVDSLSEISGELNGAMFAKNIETLPEADQKRFNKTEFLKGLKEVYLTDTNNMSYILGLQIGLNMLQQQRMMDQNGVATNRDKFYSSFSKNFKPDSIPAETLAAIQNQMQILQGKAQQIMSAEQQRKQAEMLQKQEAENKANMEAGKKYVDELKAKDAEIKTTDDGLSYKVLKQGTGATATDDDRVVVRYTGKLIDGEVFDSNDSIAFSPRGVVPGFAEGLKMMNKGSKMTLYIPGDLGYGVQGGGEKIKPGATLVFDVEVLDIIKREPLKNIKK